MSDEPNKQEWPFFIIKNPILYGIIGTFSVLTIYAYLAASVSCQKDLCQTNYKHFLASPPNEIGDTLAGIAGILAFLWIIISVFMQSRELKMAREEHEKMAVAQTKQVDLLVEQGKIFLDEQRQRDEVRAKNLLNWKLEGLSRELDELAYYFGFWAISVPESDFSALTGVNQRDGQTKSYDVSFGGGRKDGPLEEYLQEKRGCFLAVRRELKASQEFHVKPKETHKLASVSDRLSEIIQLASRLSEDQRERIDVLGIFDMNDVCQELLETSEYWGSLENRSEP